MQRRQGEPQRRGSTEKQKHKTTGQEATAKKYNYSTTCLLTGKLSLQLVYTLTICGRVCQSPTQLHTDTPEHRQIDFRVSRLAHAQQASHYHNMRGVVSGATISFRHLSEGHLRSLCCRGWHMLWSDVTSTIAPTPARILPSAHTRAMTRQATQAQKPTNTCVRASSHSEVRRWISTSAVAVHCARRCSVSVS